MQDYFSLGKQNERRQSSNGSSRKSVEAGLNYQRTGSNSVIENLLKNKTILRQMNHESSSEELSDDRDDVKNKNNIEQTKEELRRKSTYVDNFQKMKLAIHSELTSQYKRNTFF